VSIPNKNATIKKYTIDKNNESDISYNNLKLLDKEKVGNNSSLNNSHGSTKRKPNENNNKNLLKKNAAEIMKKNTASNCNVAEDITDKTKNVVRNISNKIAIYIKVNEAILEYELNCTDTFQNLYKFLFGDDKTCKLLYKNTHVSKFSTLSGIKYDFDAKEEFTVRGNVISKIKDTRTVKINYACNKSFFLELKQDATFEQLLMLCEENNNNKYSKIIMNGKVMKKNWLVKEFIEENDV
ncbi:hypothetical protein COBT_003547, partial [Conglomerata obtusa]